MLLWLSHSSQFAHCTAPFIQWAPIECLPVLRSYPLQGSQGNWGQWGGGIYGSCQKAVLSDGEGVAAWPPSGHLPSIGIAVKVGTDSPSWAATPEGPLALALWGTCSSPAPTPPGSIPISPYLLFLYFLWAPSLDVPLAHHFKGAPGHSPTFFFFFTESILFYIYLFIWLCQVSGGGHKNA